MNTQEIRDILNEPGHQGDKRREKLRKMINACYKENIKSLQQKATQDCAFDLAYDLYVNTSIFKNL
jgi:hypothetical protein